MTAGRSWRRPARQCPSWCAKGHRCTAQHGYPSGEHRSEPLVWATEYGKLLATLAQHGAAPVGYLEVRAAVELPAAGELARWQAQRLAVGVDLTIRAIRAAGPGASWPQAVALLAGQAPMLPGGVR